jgi:hypothetical protein
MTQKMRAYRALRPAAGEEAGRAKKVLMLAYDIDAENAFELLRWGSQAGHVTMRVLAARLIDAVSGLAGSALDETRAACDDVLFTGIYEVSGTAFGDALHQNRRAQPTGTLT